MSFEVVAKKLLDSVKDEIQKEDNMNIINNDIIKPIVDKVLEQLYPYFIGASMIIAFIVIAVFVILCLKCSKINKIWAQYKLIFLMFV